MDQNSLVALVTQLVMEELAKPGSISAEAVDDGLPQPEPGKRVLLIGAPGSACEQAAWDALSHLTDVHWLVVDWPQYPAARVVASLKPKHYEVVTPPELWDDMVRSVDAVMIPFAPMDILAKLALLMVDVPPVAAAVAAIVQGINVLVGSDDCERLSRFSARIPRAVISVAQEHGRTVASLGVKFDTPTQLLGQMTGGVAHIAAGSSGGRDVVTNEDVMAAVQAGCKVLDVTTGSIVTSLASETAKQYGIEVRFR